MLADWELDSFHGDDYSIMNGSSQNAYLIEEEKTVLIDTVWTPHRFNFVKNLKKEIDLNKIDYIIHRKKAAVNRNYNSLFKLNIYRYLKFINRLRTTSCLFIKNTAPKGGKKFNMLIFWNIDFELDLIGAEPAGFNPEIKY